MMLIVIRIASDDLDHSALVLVRALVLAAAVVVVIVLTTND